jgi:D-alanine transaminase
MSTMSGRDPILYLNGEFVPAATATVSVDDRGFLFADGCYEVTLAVDGHCIALDRHLARLQRTLDTLRIGFDAGSLAPIHRELIDRNGLAGSPLASVYVQITRGAAPRAHAFPVGVAPTVLVRAQEIPGPSRATVERGSRAVTADDIRWGRVDLKTTGLLPNVLAQQTAVDAGGDDVILHRDGVVTEGSHANLFGVIGGALVTAPVDERILPGVVRGIVIESALVTGIAVAEREWTLAELVAADEVFMTSTTAGARPIVEIDGRLVGDGDRGPVTAHVQQLYADFVEVERIS